MEILDFLGVSRLLLLEPKQIVLVEFSGGMMTTPDNGSFARMDDETVVRRLMEAIMAVCSGGYRELDEVYSKFRIGGGFFKGRKMSGDIAKETRYELIAFTSALTRMLVENWEDRRNDSNSILGLLEPAVFSFNLENARPAYAHYLKRYYDLHQADSTVLPREMNIHSEFIQKLTIDVWDFYQELDSPQSMEYSKIMLETTQIFETWLRNILREIWPPIPHSSN